MSDSGTRKKAQSDFERNGAKALTTPRVSLRRGAITVGTASPAIDPRHSRGCERDYALISRELAKRYSVDAATVVRTVQALGYKCFADFSVYLNSTS